MQGRYVGGARLFYVFDIESKRAHRLVLKQSEEATLRVSSVLREECDQLSPVTSFYSFDNLVVLVEVGGKLPRLIVRIGDFGFVDIDVQPANVAVGAFCKVVEQAVPDGLVDAKMKFLIELCNRQELPVFNAFCITSLYGAKIWQERWIVQFAHLSGDGFSELMGYDNLAHLVHIQFADISSASLWHDLDETFSHEAIDRLSRWRTAELEAINKNSLVNPASWLQPHIDYVRSNKIESCVGL